MLTIVIPQGDPDLTTLTIASVAKQERIEAQVLVRRNLNEAVQSEAKGARVVLLQPGDVLSVDFVGALLDVPLRAREVLYCDVLLTGRDCALPITQPMWNARAVTSRALYPAAFAVLRDDWATLQWKDELRELAGWDMLLRAVEQRFTGKRVPGPVLTRALPVVADVFNAKTQYPAPSALLGERWVLTTRIRDAHSELWK